MPAGGSSCNLLKSLMSLFLAGVDILTSHNLYSNQVQHKQWQSVIDKPLCIEKQEMDKQRATSASNWLKTVAIYNKNPLNKESMLMGLIVLEDPIFKTTHGWGCSRRVIVRDPNDAVVDDREGGQAFIMLIDIMSICTMHYFVQLLYIYIYIYIYICLQC